jgi:glyoxylase-like metal-dependent hydrolase (beta-lactamase superfamily II)
MRIKDIFGVYPFQVGNHEAWTLHDGFLGGEPVQQYAVGVSDAEIAAQFAPHSLNPERIQLGLNPILFRWGDKLILTDTGIGSVAGEPIGLLDKRLNALGIGHDDIDVVLLTHLHLDHIGGLLDRTSRRSRFPRARIFISRSEIEFWQVPEPDVSQLKNVPPELVELTIHCAHDALEILAKQIESFAPETDVLDGVHSIALPGHTPGQSGYLFQSSGSRFMVIGDAVHDPVLHIERPEWTSMGDARPRETVSTRREILARLADEGLRFQAYHFPFPSLGYIRSNGDGKYVFEPERWTWL